MVDVIYNCNTNNERILTMNECPTNECPIHPSDLNLTVNFTKRIATSKHSTQTAIS